jgi:hypothetical protein
MQHRSTTARLSRHKVNGFSEGTGSVMIHLLQDNAAKPLTQIFRLIFAKEVSCDVTPENWTG